jgi:hypothetical protein
MATRRGDGDHDRQATTSRPARASGRPRYGEDAMAAKKKQKQKPKKMRVRTGGDLKSTTTRLDRCVSINSALASSTLCQANTTVKTSAVTLLAAGVAVKAAEDAVTAAELVLATARDTRDTKVVAYDTAYGVLVSNVEQGATLAADVTGCGLVPGGSIAYDLAMPVSVTASYDHASAMLNVHVKNAPGMRASIVEIGSDPNGPTWTQAKGVGAKRALPGYAPGTYWVRAASARGNDQSEFTAPIAVMVK